MYLITAEENGYETNFLKSKLVGFVIGHFKASTNEHINIRWKPFSVIKVVDNSNYVIKERFYDKLGDVYLDIDYTSHGNSKTHPSVPHIHRWAKINNRLKHGHWEEFK